MEMATSSLAILLGGVAVIVFPTVIAMPFRSISFRLATIPMTVAMQQPRDVAAKSVGEKASPLP